MIILIAIFCAVVYTDLRFYKIPNACILAGMVSGLFLTCVSYSIGRMLLACMAMAIVFAVFYPFYLMGGLGAGDVKLLMMAGCFIQGMRLMQYLLITFMAAAVIAIIKMLLFCESRERLIYFGGYLRKAVCTQSIDEYKVDKNNKRCVIRLSVPAFISLIIMCAGIY